MASLKWHFSSFNAVSDNGELSALLSVIIKLLKSPCWLFIDSVFLLCFQVERIVDKRKNKKGKWEYLIRWKGYGSKEDTWEPEHHLLHCEEFIDQFNSLNLHTDRRTKPAGKSSGGSPRHHSRPGAPEHTRARGDHRKKKRPSVTGTATGVGVGLGLGAVGGAGLDSQHKPRKVPAGTKPTGDRVTKAMPYKSVPGGLQFVPSPRSPNGLQNGDVDSLHYRTNARPHAMPGGERMERMLGDLDLTGAPSHMSRLGQCLIHAAYFYSFPFFSLFSHVVEIGGQMCSYY